MSDRASFERSIDGYLTNNISSHLDDISVSRSAKPRGILGHYIQHRLEVSRRAGNDTQDFTRRSLPLQSLSEFLEQADVLDSDHRLVGEGLEEGDLLVGERTNFRSANHNGPDSFIFPQQGCNKHSASTTNLLEESRFRKLGLKFSRDVMDMDCRPVDHGPSCRVATTGGHQSRCGRYGYGSIF